MLGGLTAAGADVAEVLLLEGDAAGFHAAGNVLDFVFTRAVTAPHRLDEAGLVGGDLDELVEIMRDMGLFLHIFERTVVHIVVDLHEEIGDLLLEIIERDKELLTGIAAHQHALVLLDILGAELQTDRHTLHLILSELPSRALVGIVELYAELLLELLKELIRLIQNTFLMLGDRDDRDLDRSDLRRQNKTVVVGVYHDQRADHAGRGAPGGLVRIMQLCRCR